MHYVCGDIHGQYDDYMQILEQIDLRSDDTLYIIGDAIDRGPRPVDVLIDIMSRKNVVFTIGNHEHMMIQSLLYEDSNQLYSWTLNGAETTYKQWDELDTDKQAEILSWLNECPIVIPDLYVNGRNYYLTHACHLPYAERKRVRYCDVPVSRIEEMVWARTYQYPNPKKLAKKYRNLYQAYPNTTLIVGHNPVYRCSYGIQKKMEHVAFQERVLDILLTLIADARKENHWAVFVLKMVKNSTQNTKNLQICRNKTSQ